MANLPGYRAAGPARKPTSSWPFWLLLTAPGTSRWARSLAKSMATGSRELRRSRDREGMVGSSARRGRRMDLSAINALDRTAILMATDLLGGEVSHRDVVEGLLAFRVRIRATEQALFAPAAQHAVVTLPPQLAMCAISIHLDVPDAEVLTPQPRLCESSLGASILEHIHATWPWVDTTPGDRPQITYVIGDTPPFPAADIVVTGEVDHIRVGHARFVQPSPWMGTWPTAPVGAGISAAAIAVRAAARRMAALRGIDQPVALSAPDLTDLRIATSRLAQPSLGEIPVISAGAVTHGLMYVLQRVPDLTATFDVFDDDVYDVPNLNRYPLLTIEDLGNSKAPSTPAWSRSRLQFRGRQRRYTGGEGAGAERILVGADNIAVRWTAQGDAGRWLGIGSTSHLFAEVSTPVLGGPCSGCTHDHQDEAPEVIPTISVVSGWAGLMLANELLRSALERRAGGVTWSYPLGLGGRRAHSVLEPQPNPRCARNCAASRLSA